MDNRKYNIYFHTHTISGIIICALLYVIFFAGSFSFFKEDLSAWQKNSSPRAHRSQVHKDFNKLLDSLANHYKLKGRDFDFYMHRNGMGMYVNMSPSNDSTLRKKTSPGTTVQSSRGRKRNPDAVSFTYDFARQKSDDYTESYDIGEFLYRLHFLAQLNQVPIRLGAPFGYLLAGIVSFIFLFALVTGLLLHWNKIVSNFFVFRPWSKWKTVWTDLHTALGVVGFPFQFIYAVTGVILIFNSFLLLPYTKFLYNGDGARLYKDLEYTDNMQFEYTYQPLTSPFNLNEYLQQVERKWGEHPVRLVSIRNFQDANMHLIITSLADPHFRFSGIGKIIYRVRDHKVLHEQDPSLPATYVGKIKSLVYHLHFGDFGGRPLRIMFFVLGVMGCLIIISGILIWLVARDKNSVPTARRRFNFWTANIFLSSCLSMLPVTAFTLIVLLFLDRPQQSDIFHWYFYSWLLLGTYFVLRRDLVLTSRQSIFLSAILCFLVPVFHGVVRDQWVWHTFEQQAYDILFIDLLFLSLSIICLLAFFRIRKQQALNKPTKHSSATLSERPVV